MASLMFPALWGTFEVRRFTSSGFPQLPSRLSRQIDPVVEPVPLPPPDGTALEAPHERNDFSNRFIMLRRNLDIQIQLEQGPGERRTFNNRYVAGPRQLSDVQSD